MGLKQKAWETNDYYLQAREGSLDVSHSGIKLLRSLIDSNKKILDLGCGEGTRLSLLSKSGTGVDISSKAINLAKKKYPKLNFILGNLEKLPFKDGSFDLVYSAYVFEHLMNPEKVIDGVVRVLRRSGNIVIICPNYGAPNRASPPFKGSRIKKLIFGFLNDLLYPFQIKKSLSWNKVKPITEGYESDWDVTIEPYSLSLENYLNNNGFLVKKNLQTWSYELSTAKMPQKLFRALGTVGLYPFRFWSPHIVIQAKKL